MKFLLAAAVFATVTMAIPGSSMYPADPGECCCCSPSKQAYVCRKQAADDGCFCILIACPANAPTIHADKAGNDNEISHREIHDDQDGSSGDHGKKHGLAPLHTVGKPHRVHGGATARPTPDIAIDPPRED